MTGATHDAPSEAAPRPARRAWHARFATTRWSMVLLAGEATEHAPAARDALTRLCQGYWYPIYAHIRRRGHSAHDAEDLTQEFFARLLERNAIAQADPQRGRFRSFILTSLNHFLTDEWEKTRTLKRGGGHGAVPLDRAVAEERFSMTDAAAIPPDQAFDREWALAVLRGVVERLGQEYRDVGKGELFEVLKPTLTGSRDAQPYAELATRLGRNEGAVKVAVHRLRLRYRGLLRATIADTVSSEDETDAELRLLQQALAAGA